MPKHWSDEFRFAELHIILPTPEVVMPLFARFGLIAEGDIEIVRAFLEVFNSAFQNVSLISSRLPEGSFFALDQATIPPRPGSEQGATTIMGGTILRMIGEPIERARLLEMTLRLTPMGRTPWPILAVGWGPTMVHRELLPWSASEEFLEPLGEKLPRDIRSMELWGTPTPADDVVGVLVRKTPRNGIVLIGNRVESASV